MGVGSVAVYSEADAAFAACAPGRRGRLHRPGAGGAELPATPSRSSRRRSARGAAGHPPRLRLPVRERRLRRGLRGSGHRLHRPDARSRCAPSASSTRARELAERNGVPLLPGSGLLADAGHAHAEAARIGYPVMLKSTAGGGGIGMQLCWSADELARRLRRRCERLARANFSDAGVFLEKYVEQARHIEVQIFGDGAGDVRRAGRARLLGAAAQPEGDRGNPGAGPAPTRSAASCSRPPCGSAQAVGYRSAGTVEFVFDAASGEFYFLEVNTRLQVEHGVTEEVTGIDLVEWMVRAGGGRAADLAALRRRAARARRSRCGSTPRTRRKDFQPSAGLLTEVAFPDGRARRHLGRDRHRGPALLRPDARQAHRARPTTAPTALAQAAATRWRDTRVAGIETNLAYLRQVVRRRGVRATGRQHHALPGQPCTTARATVEVLEPGAQTTRAGLAGPRSATGTSACRPPGRWTRWRSASPTGWSGNAEGAAGAGDSPSPARRCASTADAVIALTGARHAAPSWTACRSPLWRRIAVQAGSVLQLGAHRGRGLRAYLAVRGRLRRAGVSGQPSHLHARPVRRPRRARAARRRRAAPGRSPARDTAAPSRAPPALMPQLRARTGRSACSTARTARRTSSPTTTSTTFFATDWEVHYNSSRTGVRLIGPKPAVGAHATAARPACTRPTSTTTPMPSARSTSPATCRSSSGPDGPSLGGFVCPATIVQAELWKLGQLRPGDTRALRAASRQAQAGRWSRRRMRAIATLAAADARRAVRTPSRRGDPGAAPHAPARDDPVAVVYRQAGDDYLLVEYGPLVLDLELRFRVHALMQWLQARSQLPGIVDLTPGIRSLQVHYDSRVLPLRDADRAAAARAEDELPAIEDMQVPTPHRAPAAVLGRSGHAAGDREVHAVGAPGRALVPEQHRVHPPHQRPRHASTRCSASSSTPATWCWAWATSTSARRWPRRSTRATAWSPPSTTRRAPGRRRTPSASAAPTCASTAWKARAATSSSAAPCRCGTAGGRPPTSPTASPGCCASSTRSASIPVSAGRAAADARGLPARPLPAADRGDHLQPARLQPASCADNSASIAAFKHQQQAAFDAERERWRASRPGRLRQRRRRWPRPRPTASSTCREGGRAIASHVAGNVWKVQVEAGQQVQAGRRAGRSSSR